MGWDGDGEEVGMGWDGIGWDGDGDGVGVRYGIALARIVLHMGRIGEGGTGRCTALDSSRSTCFDGAYECAVCVPTARRHLQVATADYSSNAVVHCAPVGDDEPLEGPFLTQNLADQP